MSFQLPPNVTAQRKPISATSYEYILRHSELGQLGQIMLSACTSVSYTHLTLPTILLV